VVRKWVAGRLGTLVRARRMSACGVSRTHRRSRRLAYGLARRVPPNAGYRGRTGDHVRVPLSLIPETVIEERPSWTIAVNRNQDLLGKTMLVLRRGCVAVVDIEPDEWSSLHRDLQQLVPALERLFEPDRFNFAFLMNLDRQVHLHVIPRYASPRYWHEREFTDAHWGSAFGHEQHVLDRAELKLLAAEIRAQLQRDGAVP
jgi:diadenosine tetraphosphate (Ap4A) HIT family hydrolase